MPTWKRSSLSGLLRRTYPKSITSMRGKKIRMKSNKLKLEAVHTTNSLTFKSGNA